MYPDHSVQPSPYESSGPARSQDSVGAKLSVGEPVVGPGVGIEEMVGDGVGYGSQRQHIDALKSSSS